MVTMAQRIEALRTQQGLTRPALSAALGLPRNAVEKFETGRQTPTKEQQEKIAAYFGVSLFYLRGESSDRTRQEDWMDLAAVEEGDGHVPMAPISRAKPARAEERTAEGGASLLDSLLSGKQAQEALRTAVLEVLRSPEGQALIAKAVHKELSRGR